MDAPRRTLDNCDTISGEAIAAGFQLSFSLPDPFAALRRPSLAKRANKPNSQLGRKHGFDAIAWQKERDPRQRHPIKEPRMKKVLFVAAAMMLFVSDANAVVYCAAGVYRAGCVARPGYHPYAHRYVHPYAHPYHPYYRRY
jgi:hypothetical protein